MEKSTRSSRKISEKKKWFAARVGLFTMIALLVSAVVFVAVPGSTRVIAASQLNYRTATFSAGANPSAAKIGDLDGDGLNDIAVVNIQGNLQLFFNNGAGSFNRVSVNGLWSSSSNTRDIDIGDLNRDGRNDIAVAFSTQNGAVSVLFNQGNRTFTAPVNYNSCNSSKGVAIGDLDQDGDNDMADISQCSRSGILINNGQGGFALNGTYGSGSASRSVALVDLNKDGFKDIVYVNQDINGTITVMLNNRNATFGSPAFYYAGDLPDAVTAGDFDGDGAVDVAIANSYYSQVIFLLGDGNGSFYSYSELTAGDTPTSIASADFNGDGLLDVAVTSMVTNTLTIATNLGNYNFAHPITFSVGQAPVDVAAGKLDGDALPDLVAVNQSSGSITVLFSTVGASPPPPPPPPPQTTLTVSTRTTSQARLVDLQWSGATSSSIEVYRNGSRIATVSNSGRYTDQMNKRAKGIFRYKVCAAGGQTCSNEATISF